MAEAAKKLNRSGGSHSKALRVPYSLMRQTIERNGKERKLSRAQLITAAAIFSFTQRDDKTNEIIRSADFTLSELSARYNYSKSSASRGVKVVIDNGLAKRADKIYKYDFEGEVGDDGFLIVEDWLWHAEFDFEAGRDYLTNSEVIVLSYLISQTKNRKTNIWKASDRHIARRLILSPTTVGKSLERLKSADLIYLTGEAKNKYTRKTFSVNFELLNQVKAEVVKRSKGEKNSVKEANERADREAYYAHWKAIAEDRAERMNARARADEVYRIAEKEVKILDFEIAKAEVHHLPTLPDLQKKQREAKERRARRLEALNMSEIDLLPKWRCERCSDTGFLPNGRACDCYPGRGRP